MKTICSFVVAGTGSGVGKTSLTLGLVAALRRRSLSVQTFKVGPDYLDPTYLARASGRTCYNLDGWMTGREYVEWLAAHASEDVDAAIIEGVMGLYDGADPARLTGSTAEIAQWLGAPVLLVVNAHGALRSIAALVHGFVTMPGAPRIAGVIANHVGTQRHVAGLREALASLGLPPLLGAVPRGGLPVLSSRHLGLTSADDRVLSDGILAELADACERHLDLDSILAIQQPRPSAVQPLTRRETELRLGVAMDEAFHFYYPDNLDLLRAAGVTIVPFSPMRDCALPDNLDGLWLGGGYPEEQAAALSGNEAMRGAIRRFACARRPIYAECGGLMYLAEHLTDRAGTVWPMVGVLPVHVRMLTRLKRLGYASVETACAGLWGAAGTELRGHEFHYSEAERDAVPSGWQPAYRVTYRDGRTAPEGFWNGAVLASYVHVHLGSRREAVESFVAFLAGARREGCVKGIETE